MRKQTRHFLAASALLVAGCGGGGGGGGGSTPPPPPPALTYTATAVTVDLARSADGQALPVGNLPAEGATLTVE